MGKLVEIRVFAEKKAPKQTVETACLRGGGGIEGDFHASDALRAVSLMPDQVGEEIVKRGLKGFCTSKFSANLLTSGLDYMTLRAGDRLAVGQVIVKIGQVGKACYQECPMQDKTTCPIRAQCAFGAAESAGAIRVGDDVTILSTQ